MTNVLVVGADGFLGRATCEDLSGAGATVVAADVRGADGVRALDVTDPTSIHDALDGIDAVVHLAALGTGDLGLAAGAELDPAAAVRTNVEGFTHLLLAAAEHGVRRVVWASSTTIYGPASDYHGRIDECAPMRPRLAYGATKAACELLAPVLATQLGIEVVSLRLPMVYGPGRWYGGSQRSLVDLVLAVQRGASCTVEAGADPADWIHVADAASALRALVQARAPRASYHVVGHTGSLAELAGAIAEGSPAAAVRTVPGGAPDLPLVSDARLRADTGWQPRFADAAAGAAHYLAHERGIHREDPR